MPLKVFLIPNNRDEAVFKQLLDSSVVEVTTWVKHKTRPWYTLHVLDSDCDFGNRPMLTPYLRHPDADYKFTVIDSARIAEMQIVPEEALVTYLMSLS